MSAPPRKDCQEVRNRVSGRPPLRALAVAGTAGVVLALAACGQQASGAQAPVEIGTGTAPPAAPDVTTTEIADAMDIVNARIPAPAAGSGTAQVEVTFADTNTVPDALRAASSPAARAVVFTSNGHTVPQISIPVANGVSVSTGPPYPDRILLTGLREQLRAGQTVAISLTFAKAGRATLQVPVIPPTP
jgi:copper(I)-binding protein